MRPNCRDFITSNVKNECHPDTQSLNVTQQQAALKEGKSKGGIRVAAQCQFQLQEHTSTGYDHCSNKQTLSDERSAEQIEPIAAILEERTSQAKKYHTQGHTRVQAEASPSFCLLKQGISEQTWELSNLASFCAEKQRPRLAGYSVSHTDPTSRLCVCYEPSLSARGWRKTRREIWRCATKTQVPPLVEVLRITDGY